jgi:PPK2 family polyphosphate:nucleotide phosphotransferase
MKKKIKLSDIPTRADKKVDKDKTKDKTADLVRRLSELQNVLYAENKRSLLIVLQGMDASGKDGAVKKVFQGVNPLGCRVQPFKAPTPEELAHDFLWRIHKHTPEKGMIQIFNRSHYEDVLITRIHNWIDDETTHRRFGFINSFEECLQAHETHILKFYLHISPEEQVQRLKERATDPTKLWKYNPADLVEAALWKQYMKVYEDVFENCSPEIPWVIVPSDQNWYKEYIVAKHIVRTLETMDLKYPEPKLVPTT